MFAALSAIRFPANTPNWVLSREGPPAIRRAIGDHRISKCWTGGAGWTNDQDGQLRLAELEFSDEKGGHYDLLILHHDPALLSRVFRCMACPAYKEDRQ